VLLSCVALAVEFPPSSGGQVMGNVGVCSNPSPISTTCHADEVRLSTSCSGVLLSFQFVMLTKYASPLVALFCCSHVLLSW
jgi:hypothetical protein